MNEEHLKKQKWWLYGVAALVGIIFLAFCGSVILDYLEDTKKQSNKLYVTNADLPLDGVNPKEIWVDQIRTENEIVQGKVDFIQEMVVGRIKQEDERESSTHQEILVLRSEIDNLRAELKNKQSAPLPTSENLRAELRNVSEDHRNGDWNPFNSQPPFADSPPPFPPEVFAPLTCVTCNEPKNLHHVDRTIPTGTTVKAILLSSVDIPCGVKGSTDPLPVKLRIIADGRLPHKVRARLKSGIVTASVYGDLSSERVYFRLEKLTQVRCDGNYIETVIAGYVSGEDGKYGVRGTVVDKSCQLIENALMSGFLSGASNFFEAAALARLYPAGGYGCAPLPGFQPSWGQSAGQLAIAGGTEGVTNAMDALTEYFIKRAEQLRPVIQITPGRTVDITFLECADLGDLYTHERVRSCGEGKKICGL